MKQSMLENSEKRTLKANNQLESIQLNKLSVEAPLLQSMLAQNPFQLSIQYNMHLSHKLLVA